VGGNPLGSPGASAAPPFGKPLPAPNPTGAAPAAPTPSQRPPAAQPSARPQGGPSPFAPGGAAPAAAPSEKKVTLVIDDSAVKEDEIGRKSQAKSTMLVVIGIVVGLAVGFGVGSTGAERKQYNMAVADGKDIYAKIQNVSKTLDEAKKHVKAAVQASQGGPGKKAHVDYDAIEKLVALERPFGANEFSRRRYLAFPTSTVDDLFEYYNNINLLWDKFTLLGAKTAGKTKREALDKSASAADDLMAKQYGVVFTKQNKVLTSALVLMAPKQPEEGKEPDKDAPPLFQVASKEGGREVDRMLYQGEGDFGEDYGKFVIPLDKGRSMGTLGGGMALFGDLRGDLVATEGLMTRTVEVQGRLLKELGKVAALEEQSFF
jgi:hypothetical protein